jgi:hypothetical protein
MMFFGERNRALFNETTVTCRGFFIFGLSSQYPELVNVDTQ